MLSRSGLTVLVLAASLALVAGTAVTGILTSSKTISSSGTVKAINVGVYWDSACTNATSTINWGSIEPNTTVTTTVYVKNTGNTQMTLNMTYSGWSPSNAASYMTLSWNQEGVVVAPNAVVTAVLTLQVSSSITGISSFSFNVAITGTG